MCSNKICINTSIYSDGLCLYCYKYGDSKPVKEVKVKPIPKASKKRAKENRIDQKQNKEIRKQNPECQMKLIGCTGKAEGTHHMRGRTGKRLTDPKFKIAACNSCNRRAESNPNEALEKKVSIKKNTIN